MSVYMTLDCPYCGGKNSTFTAVALKSKEFRSMNCRSDVAGTCGSCSRMVVANFDIHGATRLDDLGGLTGSFTGELHTRITKISSRLLRQYPAAEKPRVPQHLPENVSRSYLDAEKSFSEGHWNAAAALYRKAVDRAVSPLLEEGSKARMLGPKLGELEKTHKLPDAMLNWIRVVKDDGNFALHDDDHDFDTKEQVAPAREFAHTLLTYLYTLPEKVRLAREGAEGLKAAE